MDCSTRFERSEVKAAIPLLFWSYTCVMSPSAAKSIFHCSVIFLSFRWTREKSMPLKWLLLSGFYMPLFLALVDRAAKAATLARFPQTAMLHHLRAS